MSLGSRVDVSAGRKGESVRGTMRAMTVVKASHTAPRHPLGPAESAAVRRLRAWLYSSVLVTLVTALWFWPAWHLIEDQARDVLTARFAVSKDTHPSVVLVDFSDASIQALGGWPLDRRKMADLVEELVGPLGARVVGLDMVFPETGDAIGDARLASLAEHGPVVLSNVLDMQQRSSPIRVGVPAIKTAPPQLLAARWGTLPSYGYVANHAGLARARCVGHVGVTLDPDGVMRRLAPLVRGPSGVLNTLSAAMLDCGEPSVRALQDSPSPAAQPPRAGTWRLPFTYGVNAFDSVEAADVLEGRVDPAHVRGKYVLVGSSAVGLSDYVTTPLQPLTPGVLVHAEALAHLLDHGVPQAQEGRHWGVLLFTGLMGALLWWLWQRNKVRAGCVALAAGLVWPVLVLACYAHGVFPWLLYFPAVTWGALGAITVLELKLQRDTKQRALRTLSQYVAEPVLKQLYALGLSNNLQPKLQEITVMVVDMRDYTRLTSEMSLEEIAQLTRDFLRLITQPVLKHEGTLDRYNGDGLIAFWGAPLPQANHADRALACAQSLRDALRQWNVQRTAIGHPAIGMRIGIESGQALVGDVGNAARSVYTAVGTCINTASRLQELGRQLDCDLMVGPQTAALSTQVLQPLATVNVKGLNRPLQVYTHSSP